MWQNRIIGYETVPPDQLLANPFNHRIHTRVQQDHMESVLDEIGWIDDVIVNKTTGHIIDGHLRVTLALRKESDVPVKFVEMTEAEEKLALASFDYITSEAVVDPEMMSLILEEVKEEYPDLMLLKDIDTELETGVFDDDKPDDPGPEIDKAEELREKWGVESGQLWQLGEHRIICGDCTDKEVVDRLMGGDMAEATITDPPFFVRGDEWDTFRDEEDFAEFTRNWLLIAYGHSNTVSLFFADKYVPLLLEVAAKQDVPYRRALIWRKPPGSQFAGASLDGYWFDFEIIQVFGKPSFPKRQDTQMGVFEHRTITGQEHGAQKPIELLEDIVNGYTQEGHLVFEPFNGTGTTLIACERLNRKCYGIEIEPKYIAVTLERWSEMTSQTPVLLD